MPTPEHTLQKVAMDNIRTVQIGGETDGISPEVAADIGYVDTTPEDIARLVIGNPQPDAAHTEVAPNPDGTYGGDHLPHVSETRMSPEEKTKNLDRVRAVIREHFGDSADE